MAELKTRNTLQVAGTLVELNLERKTTKAKIKDWDNNTEKEVECEVIGKKDFRNPALLVACDLNGKENIVGVNLGDVYSKAFKDGQLIDNPDFKARETILNEYVIRTNATEEVPATRVYVNNGYLAPNEYVSKDDFQFKVQRPNIATYNVTSSGVPEQDICEGIITGFIGKIVPEMKKVGEDQEETGRLQVEVYIFTNGKSQRAFPMEFVLEEDLATDFTDNFKKGDSVTLSYDILRKQIGTSKAKKGFGRRASNVVSGYSIDEFNIFDGDNIEEESNEFISKETIKKMIDERKIYIDALIAKKKEAEKKGAKKGFANKPAKTTSKATKNTFEDLPETNLDTPEVEEDDIDDIF